MEPYTAELREDFVQMPISIEGYPHVTISMVIDALTEAHIEILHEAPKPRRVFRWYQLSTYPDTHAIEETTVDKGAAAKEDAPEQVQEKAADAKSKKGKAKLATAKSKGDPRNADTDSNDDAKAGHTDKTIAAEATDESISVTAQSQTTNEKKSLFDVKERLYLCTADTVRAVLSTHKKAYACVIVDPDDPLEFINDNSARCLVASSNENRSIDDVIHLIKAVFIKMLIWERSLEIIALKDCSLNDMFEVSIPILKNFVFASDFDANVIAATTTMEPPDELHKKIMKNKFLDEQMLKDLRPRSPQGEFCTYEMRDPSIYKKISYPIFIECTYTGSISMACNNRMDTKGLRDQFKLLCDRCMPFFRKLWVNQISTNSPSFFFFNRLLERDQIDDEYLEAQKNSLGLATMNRFKLVVLDVDVNFDVARLKRVKDAAAKVNSGRIHVFPYHDKLLMLLYGSVNEDLLDHVRIMNDIKNYIFEPFHVQASISSIFYNITDLELAYQQALVGFQYRPAILRARFANDDYNNEALVTFEAALMYYLIDDIERDERFLRFAFSSSVANTLYREDLESGTNHLSILWCYLYNERNATAVAESLHMHRNTVLYNIQKIEQRFGLSLNDKTVRDWILLCFRYLILNTETKILDSSLTIE